MASYTHLRSTETMAEKLVNENRRERVYNKLTSSKFYEWNKIEKSFAKDWTETIMLENRLKEQVIGKIREFETTYFPSWVQSIKDYTLSTIDRALELRKKKREFMTNEKQPIVRTYVDRLIQGLFRTNFFIKAYPLTKVDVKKTEAVQTFIDRCFSSSKAKSSLLDMWVSAVTNWIWFARTGFNMHPEKVNEIKGLEKKKNHYMDDYYSQFEWVSEFCIFWEPFTPFYDQRYIIYRKILPMKTILSKISRLDTQIEEEHVKYMLDNWQPCSTKNYDKVRLIKYKEAGMLETDNFDMDNHYEVNFDNDFCEYIEYWADENLVVMVNWYIVFDWENPLPWRVSPFKLINYTRYPWVRISDGVGTLLAWQQKLYDALYNISFDLLRFAAWPVFLKQPWMAIEGMEETFTYEPFSFKQIRWPGKLETLEMPKPDMSISKWMTDILNMSNFAISPTTYGQTEWVSRSATDSQYRYEWLKDALLMLITSMNEMLTITAQERLSDAVINMPSKFSLPVLNKSWKVDDRKEIQLEDIQWKFIFERDSESIRDINKVVERSQLAQLTSFLKTFWQDPITQRRMIDSEKLLQQWVDLFNWDPGTILTNEEYQKKVIASQKDAIKIQKELQKFQQKELWVTWRWPENAEGGEWHWPLPAAWSSYNASWATKDPNQAPLPETWWVDMSSILKQANE